MANTKRNSNKKGKILIPLGNVYALGGDLMGGLLGGVTSLAGSAISNLTVPEVENQKITANSNESFMNQSAAYKPIEIEKANAGSSALSGAASGASAGMAFGPWGAAVGGLVGGLSGGISALIGNKKKERREVQLQQQLKQGFTSKLNEIDSNNFNNIYAQSLAQGGSLNTFENGGTHEQNPLGGIPQGVDENGTPNLVEQGESKYNNYIFSDRLKYDKKNTFSDMAKKFAKESKERPNDAISKRGLESNLGKLRQSQDMFKAMTTPVQELNTFALGGGFTLPTMNPTTSSFSMVPPIGTVAKVPKNTKSTKKVTPIAPIIDLNNPALEMLAAKPITGLPVTTPKMQLNFKEVPTVPYTPDMLVNSKGNDYSTMLRYAPALASGIASITDALGKTNKPDYTAASEMDALSVKGERVGNYLGYTPMDLNYFINTLGANSAATRTALKGASGGNRAAYMAGLLGADASYNEGLGKLARQAAESNLSQKQQVEQFNRGTNQFNAQQSNWEQGINMQNKGNAINLREQARQISDNAKTTNLNNFVESLGGIGSENLYRNMIKNDPSSPYYIDAQGNYIFKGAQKKNGGKLKTKGITYGW